MSSDDEASKSTQTGKSPQSSTAAGLNSQVMMPSHLLLHPSDNPSNLFVGELLSDANYGEWVVDITDSLIAKNKICFVDGTLPPANSPAEKEALLRCNAMVKGWLKTSMTKEVRSSVRFASTAREIWIDLQSRFGQGSAARLYELKSMIVRLRQEKASVSSFYTKLRGLWDEIQTLTPSVSCTCSGCTCDGQRRQRDVRDGEQLFDFLMGLDDVFSTVKSQILAMRPTPTLAEAYQLVSHDEQQRMISSNRRPRPEATVFQAHGEKKLDRPSLLAESDRDKDRDADGKPKCTHCKRTCHFWETCYRLIGFPPKNSDKGESTRRRADRGARSSPQAAQVDAADSPLPGLSARQFDQLKALLAGDLLHHSQGSAEPSSNMAGTYSLNSASWVIDSGCNEHIVNHASLLDSELDSNPALQVKIPNGTGVSVRSIGTAKLSDDLLLRRVLHVPDFQCNLLSVSRLTADLPVALIFMGDLCVIQDLPSKRLIGMGKHVDVIHVPEIVRTRAPDCTHSSSISG
ncbi:unnamed protein product [Linum trigynum]|uniref:Retrotransposon Copia-like N-terminal domain-containing protein n=1 Tax=Linum trigynum TaxID=586398 RepID=A0AAV2ES56_9ROSI